MTSLCMGWLFSETVCRNEPIFLQTACILSREGRNSFSDGHNFRILILIFGANTPVVAHYQLVVAESF